MNNKKKKAVHIRPMAAVIFCIITFAIGYALPSFFLLDSRIESANEEISQLKQTVTEKNSEIKELNNTIKLKDEANVALGDRIEEDLQTIDGLKAKISDLESDIDFAAQAAVSGFGSISDRDTILNARSSLSTTQQMILLLALFIVFIIIISITCVVISSVRRGKKPNSNDDDEDDDDEEDEEEEAPKMSRRERRRERKMKKAQEEEDAHEAVVADEAEAPSENVQEESGEEAQELQEEQEETPIASYDTTLIDKALDMLYDGSLEDNVDELGGFRFGVTNFEEILSDKARGKSFGNSDDGDFIAFMDSRTKTKKLYIIPRYLTLSDSAVSLRGTTDLFDIADENGNVIIHGSVKIKSVASPAIFAFGENGWAIEAKGRVTAL